MVDKRSVCDGIEIDKNIIASYLSKVQQGTANFELVRVYYSAKGHRCQSGNCNKRIHNVFIFVDKDTDQEYEIGSHCAAKYGNDVEQLVQYWLKKLNHVTAQTLKQAKYEERVQKNIATHRERYNFILAYLEITPSRFMSSIKRVIEKGWDMSEKQAAAIDKIMGETDLTTLVEKVGEDYRKYRARLWETIKIIERLDRVSFGQRPTAYTTYRSIRQQFGEKGYVTDKQLELLKKYMHTFRRQIPQKNHS